MNLEQLGARVKLADRAPSLLHDDYRIEALPAMRERLLSALAGKDEPGARDLAQAITIEFEKVGAPITRDAVLAQAKEYAATNRALDKKVAAGEFDGWTAPQELPGLPTVDKFAAELLPDAFRTFALDIADRTQAPLDYVAVGLIVSAGSVIGRKLAIRPRSQHDWQVTPNLWGAGVGASGMMKSPAFAAALKPIRQLQADAFRAHQNKLAEWESQARAAVLVRKANEDEARQKLREKRDADVSALLKHDPVNDSPPAPRRYVVTDSSVEALTETLMENPNGVLIERDEIAGLLASMDREEHAGERQFYLTGADGDKSYTVDRIGRGRHRHIEAVCISLLGGIQPGPLAKYVRDACGNGGGADGLLQRFALIVWPDSSVWRDVDRWPDTEARKRVVAIFMHLDTFTAETIGAERDDYGELPFVRFDGEAQAIFSEWLADLKNRIRQRDEHPAFAAHLEKRDKTVAALALICHLVDGGKGAVGTESVLRALAWFEYLETHARRVYANARDPAIEGARLLRDRLGKLPAMFTPRDVYLKGWAGLSDRDAVRRAAEVLTDCGYLRGESNASTGGRPVELQYRAHPTWGPK